jgi:tetratricopeptide (TPR) repeat protein
VNRDFNRHVQSGQLGTLAADTNALKKIEPRTLSLDERLRFYGPVEETSISALLAQHFHRASLYRQAAQLVERALSYEPTNVNLRLFLISECLHLGMADRALSLVAELRARPPVPLLPEDRIDLTRAEAWAQFNKRDLPAAERVLREAQRQFPLASSPFETLADIYRTAGQFTNAVAVYENQVKAQPENSGALVNLAYLLIGAGQHEKALPFLERALKLKPGEPNALFNRGLCHLHIAQLVAGQVNAPRVDAALADFLQLASILPKSPAAAWGIAECYRLKKNKTEALKYYTKFLEVAPPGNPDRPLAEQRIKVLKSGGF